MEKRNIPFSRGTLRIIEALPNPWKIEHYICSNSYGLFYCKVFPFPVCSSAFANELSVLMLISSSQLTLPLIECSKTMASGYTIFSLHDCTLLSQYIASISQPTAIKLLQNLLSSISSFHSLNLIHGNITIDTLFVDKDLNIKITGFEYSKQPENPEAEYENHQAKDYRSPEVLENISNLNYASDLWSIGCVGFIVLYKEKPFDSLKGQREGRVVERPQEIFKSFFQKVFAVDPRFRASVSELEMTFNDRRIENRSKFNTCLYRSTNSWVKWLTQDKDTQMETELFIKLVKKTSEYPDKIGKFYSSLLKRSLYKAQVCLRCLALMHLFTLKLFELNPKVNEVLEKMLDFWKGPEASIKKYEHYFSGTTSEVVKNLIWILKEKYRMRKDWLIGYDYELELKQQQVRDIMAYNKRIINLLEYVVSLIDYSNIYKDIIQALVEEQQHLTNLLIRNYNSISYIRDEYIIESSRLSKIIHEIYIKFPLLELTLVKLYSRELMSQSSEDLLPKLIDFSQIKSDNPSLCYRSDFADYIIPTLNDIHLIKSIGKGSSCTVYLCTYKGIMCAAKIMTKNNPGKSFSKEFHREIDTLRQIQHENLVKFIGSYLGEDSYIITEYCAGKNLFNLLHKQKNIQLSWKQRLKFALDIAEGMKYLHSITPPIIHRDLKSLNLLLKDPIESSESETIVKITDFGVSRILDLDMMTGHIGTCHWMAPEILKGEQYGLPSDVYSFGIVLWEILSRETPYKGIDVSAIPVQVIVNNMRPRIDLVDKQCPKEILDLMKGCWESEPGKRPNFDEIVIRISEVYRAIKILYDCEEF